MTGTLGRGAANTRSSGVEASIFRWQYVTVLPGLLFYGICRILSLIWSFAGRLCAAREPAVPVGSLQPNSAGR